MWHILKDTWQQSLTWAVALIVCAPGAVVLLSEVMMRLRLRGHPLEGTLRIVRNLVVPAAAVYLLIVRVAVLPPDGTLARVSLTVLWVFLIHAVLSLANVLMFARAHEASWQARLPKLLRDLGRSFLVLVGTAIVLSEVWGLDLGKVVAALGVGSIVLGLALQEPLGNLFSGIMLLLEHPLTVGHWVKIGENVGQVVEINWRALHLLVRGNEVVVVPNSSLAKNSFTNYSRPTPHYRETLTLGFSYDDPPNKVKRVLLAVARRTPGILAEPDPVVRTANFGDFTVDYRLTFCVADYTQLGTVRDELMTRVWYAARRHGLNIPYPVQTCINAEQEDVDAAARAPLPPESLRAFPQFDLDEVDALAPVLARTHVRQYARGEVVAAEGDALPGLHLILAGQVALSVKDATGAAREIARLGRGDYFGERALLSSQVSEVTVTALDDLELVVLDNESLQRVLDRQPRLAREIGGVMESRRRASQAARRGAAGRR